MYLQSSVQITAPKLLTSYSDKSTVHQATQNIFEIIQHYLAVQEKVLGNA